MVQNIIPLLDNFTIRTRIFAVYPEQGIQYGISAIRVEIWRMLRYISTELSEVSFHAYHTPEIGWCDISSTAGILQVGNKLNITAGFW